MSDTIYLYLKTHNITGLKYLGKTTKDPFKYNGSGKYWLRHLNKHGYDISTEILYETTNETEFKQVGTYYSEKWNIVESKEFANLMIETGTGGDNSQNIDYKILGDIQRGKPKKKNGDETKKRKSVSKKKFWESEDGFKAKELRYSGSQKEFNDNIFGPPCPGWLRIASANLECPHCGKIGDAGNMKRWHFDNCKHK